MRKAWADLSRIDEVRDSARGWKAAGAIDPPALAAIESAYPDPRIRLHGFWRVLIFVLVSAIVNALFWMLQWGAGALFAASLVFAGLLVAATEALRGSRHSGTGLDAASSFWAIVYLLVALGDLLFRGGSVPEDMGITAIAGAAAVVATLAAWRWGFWFYAALASLSLYVFFARFPLGRAIWVAVSLLVMWRAWRRLDPPALTPHHRRCVAAAFAVSAAALYVAVNLYSLDHRVVEALEAGGPGFESLSYPRPAEPLLRVFSGLATAVVPVALIALGMRSRRTLLLSLGLAAAALSAATLRFYVHIAPLWVVLGGCGALLIGVAMAIQRALRRRPGEEWRGLTAAPLYESERGGISPLAALAAHAAGGAAPASERGGMTTGGGQYGGGGATGTY